MLYKVNIQKSIIFLYTSNAQVKSESKDTDTITFVVAVELLSRVWLFGTPGTVACQVPLSKRFLRQKHWSGLPCPSSGDLLDAGIKLNISCIGRQILYLWLRPQESPSIITKIKNLYINLKRTYKIHRIKTKNILKTKIK